MAAVEEINGPIYERLELGRDFDVTTDETSLPNDKAGRNPLVVSSSIRAMTRLLSSTRKCLSLFRGFGWFALWNLVKGLIIFATIKHSWWGFVAQILLPMPLIQLHILWVHSVIASPSPKSIWGRIVSTKTAFKAVGPPMALLLTMEAIMQRIIIWAYKSMGLKGEDFYLFFGDFRKTLRLWLLLAVLIYFIIVPAHMLLVRVETSLFPADEKTIISLDPELSIGKPERGHINILEAWTSFSRTHKINLALLYFKIFFMTAALGFLVFLIDFSWWFALAMSSWRF